MNNIEKVEFAQGIGNILPGSVNFSLPKVLFQQMIAQQLDPEMDDEIKQKLSYQIAGNLLESPHGLVNVFTALNGQEVTPLLEVHQYIIYKVNKTEYRGKITAVNPFSKYLYSVEYYKLAGDEKSEYTRTDDVRNIDNILPIDVDTYEELEIAQQSRILPPPDTSPKELEAGN